MPFIQQPDNQNSCGAYSLCYLLWRKENRSPNEEIDNYLQKKLDKTYAKTLYTYIQFYDLLGKNILSDYSNPLQMMMYLQLVINQRPTFYVNLDNDNIQQIYTAILKSAQGDLIENLIISNQIILTPLTELKQNNQYFILICSVGRDTANLHYIYVESKEEIDEKLEKKIIYNQINPWTGILSPMTEGQFLGNEPIISASNYPPLYSLGTGILVN